MQGLGEEGFNTRSNLTEAHTRIAAEGVCPRSPGSGGQAEGNIVRSDELGYLLRTFHLLEDGGGARAALA